MTEIVSLLHYPPELPITGKREEIVRAIIEHQVLVITGETGSGKSTQIPKMCIEAGQGANHLIGCTQPRRIAAIALAGRVSEELGDERSRWVGYKIRFQDRTGRATRIKFMTDGILLAEAQKDRLFRAYDTIIIDEAHERTLNIDFLLGLVKKVLPRRPDLKVIITSATIDPEKFSRAFGDAPIIEVSGRMYPVDVRYRPPAPADEEGGESSYVDDAVAAVHELKSRRDASMRGDVLVFMPTESDIRETVARLEEKRYWNTLVLPLFGRMAAADQQRVFRSTPEEKIVVATNVAETSITIPRIRFVIDTGLARLSQYNARSRTQGLPVVPVSQSSADQRKGRCGRVEAGICIRLYSKEHYLGRPLFTAPEIQRSNLAEVILRMLFLRMGSIQEFPFLDPPSPAAVKDGFGVLKELGAVDDHRRLTPLGRTMARLPLDPRLARILLEAKKEHALREAIVLTSALSIQDPRERPIEKEAQADQAQAVFRDPRSDFVSLLKIWEAVHRTKPDAEGSESPPAPSGATAPSASRLRRFCRDHFLSFRRMREWQDIHDEIRDILDELGEHKLNDTPASFEAIHRSLLAGYLSHVAMRKEKHIYLATKNRQAMIFPGSGLFNKGGAWIAASELVQTSRLFARTAANIEPEWLEELGAHLCRSTYFEPHWEKSRGQVVAFERVTLYGLPIVERRKVNYGRVHPEEAREIFIRSALVEGEAPGVYGFMEHNRQLIQRIEELESKARRRDLLVDEEALYRFYDQRLPALADIRSFNKFIKDQGGDGMLRMTEADLLQAEPDFGALEQFPDTFVLDDLALPLRYAFRPGEEDDGVTVTVPVHALPGLSSEPFQWLVPGLLSDKVTHLLKALPKGLRRQLVPVGETAQKISQKLPFREGAFYAQLTRAVDQWVGVRVPVDQWDQASLPEHLRMRYEILGPDGKRLGVGRDLEGLRPLAVERHEDRLWDAARRTWERDGIREWDFGDLPPKIELGKDALGLTRYAYPGLVVGGGGTADGGSKSGGTASGGSSQGRVPGLPAAGPVSDRETAAIRLFHDPDMAMRESCGGLMLLYQLTFASELKHLRRAWVFPQEMASRAFFMGTPIEANRQLQEYLLRELFEMHSPRLPDRLRFQSTVERLKGQLAPVGMEMMREVFQVIEERDLTRSGLQRFRQMAEKNPAVRHRLDHLSQELDDLTPADFLRLSGRSHVQQLPRYLRALRIRGERVYVSPEKDRLKEDQLVPYRRRYDELRQEISGLPGEESVRYFEEFRAMFEEFKISLFAPEIRTRFRVSPKRLEEKWREWVSWKEVRA